MTDDQHDDRHGQGTPPSGGRWDPLPQGDYDDGATAFVKLPEGGVDALLASADSPLAAPGHGYVPPQITVTPATTAGTDPAATGTWAMPAAPVDGTQWHTPDAGHEPADPHQQGYSGYPQQDPYGGAAPYDANAGHGDRFAYRSAATGQWDFSGAAGGAGAADHAAPESGALPHAASGQDVTGQWSIPVADGDLPEESGEFTQSSLAEQWGGTAPATLPGGAPAPWATQSAGQPWGDRTEQAAPDTGEPTAGATPPAPGNTAGPYPGAPAPAPEAARRAPGADGTVNDAVADGEFDGTGEFGGSREFEGAREFEGSGGFRDAEEFHGAGDLHESGEHPGADASRAAGEAPVGAVEGSPGTDGTPGPEAAPEDADAPSAGVVPVAGQEQAPQSGREAPESEPEPELRSGQGTEAGRDPETAGEQEPAREPANAREPEPEPVTAAAAAERNPEPEPGDDHRAGPADPSTDQAIQNTDPATQNTDPADPTASVDATAADREPPSADREQPPADQEQPPAAPSGAHEEHPLASYVLRVNGADRPVTDAWIGESLLYVLRERLGLAGAKDGCSQGECGACNVQVDGRLVASCLVPAVTASGSEVRTVEGLAADGRPSDVQRALARRGAVQCGFCVPGMAMTVHNLLEGNPAPTELEARQALCGNLCRCSGYRGVLEAVKEVVAEREAHAGAETPETDAEEPRIPHQAGPGAGGVNPSAFDSHTPPGTPDAPAPQPWEPHDQPYGDQPHGQDGGHA
ncbi:2Fe-2S iron-sulfur cluster-binding protein [Streptomyces sp. DH17]|nr:2Fe-2S iron-sulfur cluster-binding protein [Streptomyces sp. DH17]